MLLVAEKSIRGGIYHAIQWYPKANNKYLENYDKNKELSYLKQCDVNNLYRCAMSSNLPANDLKWFGDTSEFDENFKKIIMKKVMKDISLKLISNTQKIYITFTMIYNLPFLPERIKMQKVKKLVANLHDKTEYIIHIRNLKQALKNGLVLKKVQRVIKFNQKSWLKP